jgi:hypothetical protein
MYATVGMSDKKVGKYEAWQVADALECLKRAEKIKQDTALLAAVKKLAKKLLEEEEASLKIQKQLAGK